MKNLRPICWILALTLTLSDSQESPYAYQQNPPCCQSKPTNCCPATSCWTGPPNYFCPSAPSSLIVYAPHDKYCTRFYVCQNGTAVEGRCPPYTYFNPATNQCCEDSSVCYKSNCCQVPVDGCQNCQYKVRPSPLASTSFYVCNCDGTGCGLQCPGAYDPCTGKYVQLAFDGDNCETTTVPTTTTTVSTTVS